MTLWRVQSGLDQQESAYIPPVVCFVQAVDDEDDDDNDRLQKISQRDVRKEVLVGRRSVEIRLLGPFETCFEAFKGAHHCSK